MQHRSKGFKISPYMQDMMLYAGQDAVYETASRNLEKFLKVKVQPKQIERLVHAYGEEVGEILSEEADRLLPTEHDDELSYVMMDGSMVLTREEKWKEVKLGRVFRDSDRLSPYEKRNWLRQSEYAAHLGDHEEFLEKLAPLIDPLSKVVFVNDGAKWIWKWVDQYYPEAVQILDYFHAVEYLGAFANEQFKEKDQFRKWMDQNKELLLEDQVGAVIEQVRYLIPRTAKAKEKKEKLLRYYQNNSHRMYYKTYRDQGLLIGSGPIESANRTVIQDRLKKSGQRWSKQGANALIQIRTAEKSGKWKVITDLIRKSA